MSGDSRAVSVSARIETLRHGPRAELVTVVAMVVAVGLGTVHWLGLVAGGALVGLLAPSLRRALVLGAYLGVIVVAAFLAWLWVFGALGPAAATGPLFGLSVALALLCPVAGAGVRGLG